MTTGGKGQFLNSNNSSMPKAALNGSIASQQMQNLPPLSGSKQPANKIEDDDEALSGDQAFEEKDQDDYEF